MARPEDGVQSAILDYLRVAAPFVFVYAIPNAAVRKRGGRAGNAVPGIVKGMPDLGLLYRRRSYFIEVKAGKNKPTAEQRGLVPFLNAAGAEVAFCWSVDDVRNALYAWGLPTREARGAA